MMKIFFYFTFNASLILKIFKFFPWLFGHVEEHLETVKALRQKELYWYHKLKTYAPFGLNECDVYTAY